MFANENTSRVLVYICTFMYILQVILNNYLMTNSTGQLSHSYSVWMSLKINFVFIKDDFNETNFTSQTVLILVFWSDVFLPNAARLFFFCMQASGEDTRNYMEK